MRTSSRAVSMRKAPAVRSRAVVVISCHGSVQAGIRHQSWRRALRRARRMASAGGGCGRARQGSGRPSRGRGRGCLRIGTSMVERLPSASATKIGLALLQGGRNARSRRSLRASPAAKPGSAARVAPRPVQADQSGRRRAAPRSRRRRVSAVSSLQQLGVALPSRCGAPPAASASPRPAGGSAGRRC